MVRKKKGASSYLQKQLKSRKKKIRYVVTLEDELRKLKADLETGTLSEIRSYKRRTEALLKYNYEYFSELAYQRSQKKEEISKALLSNARKELSLDNWHRAVRLKYSNHPLSAVGSLKDPGGRFNIGDIDGARYPIFPALYFAANQKTAISELFAQDFTTDKKINLDYFEYALSKSNDFSVATLRGTASTYFDLTDKKTLKTFVEIISDFKCSDALVSKAKRLQIAPPKVATTVSALMPSLLFSEWRTKAAFYDVPENCQIFGQLIQDSGIDGILYPSKMKTGLNFALFTRNLANSSTWVELQSTPHRLTPSRLDSHNFRLAELTFEEIEAHHANTN